MKAPLCLLETNCQAENLWSLSTKFKVDLVLPDCELNPNLLVSLADDIIVRQLDHWLDMYKTGMFKARSVSQFWYANQYFYCAPAISFLDFSLLK